MPGARRRAAPPTVIFVLSAALAGLSGALLAEFWFNSSLWKSGVQRSVDVLTMLIVGGTGVLYGSFVGATVTRRATNSPRQPAHCG